MSNLERFRGIFLKLIEEKIDRDYKNKLTIPEAKNLVKTKYEAIKTLIESMKKYMK